MRKMILATAVALACVAAPASAQMFYRNVPASNKPVPAQEWSEMEQSLKEVLAAYGKVTGPIYKEVMPMMYEHTTAGLAVRRNNKPEFDKARAEYTRLRTIVCGRIIGGCPALPTG